MVFILRKYWVISKYFDDGHCTKNRMDTLMGKFFFKKSWVWETNYFKNLHFELFAERLMSHRTKIEEIGNEKLCFFFCFFSCVGTKTPPAAKMPWSELYLVLIIFFFCTKYLTDILHITYGVDQMSFSTELYWMVSLHLSDNLLGWSDSLLWQKCSK